METVNLPSGMRLVKHCSMLQCSICAGFEGDCLEWGSILVIQYSIYPWRRGI